MGCKSTKDANQDQHESIQYDFNHVGVERYDTLWSEVFNNLRHLEKIRLEIKLLIINLQILTNSSCIKDIQLFDLLRLFMWCVVARNQGSFDDVDIQLSNQQPYFKFRSGNMNLSIQEFKYTWEQLMMNVYQNKFQYDTVCNQVQMFNNNVQQHNKTIKQEIKDKDQEVQIKVLRLQQRNCQIYKSSLVKVVAYQKEFDQIKRQMDNCISEYNKNQQQVLQKAQQMIQNELQELDQSIKMHPDYQQDSHKQSDLEHKYKRLQKQFERISIKNGLMPITQQLATDKSQVINITSQQDDPNDMNKKEVSLENNIEFDEDKSAASVQNNQKQSDCSVQFAAASNINQFYENQSHSHNNLTEKKSQELCLSQNHVQRSTQALAKLTKSFENENPTDIVQQSIL